MKIFKVGRSSQNDIIIQDQNERVSRFHAEIRVNPRGAIEIIDHSSNGTWVNGDRLQKGYTYNIRFGDDIRFANIYKLDWSKVKELASEEKTSNLTNLARDLQDIFRDLTDYDGMGKGLQRFIRCLRGSRSILRLSSDATVSKNESLHYFTLGLAGAVITFSKSKISENFFQDMETILRINFGKFDWMYEIFLSALLALFTFLVVIINYKIIKWVGHSSKRWNNYFKIYCYVLGTFFWLVTTALAPELIIHLYQPGDDITPDYLLFMEKGFLLVCCLWVILTWVKVNVLFWD
jgi:hypothetical protein